MVTQKDVFQQNVKIIAHTYFLSQFHLLSPSKWFGANLQNCGRRHIITKSPFKPLEN